MFQLICSFLMLLEHRIVTDSSPVPQYNYYNYGPYAAPYAGWNQQGYQYPQGYQGYQYPQSGGGQNRPPPAWGRKPTFDELKKEVDEALHSHPSHQAVAHLVQEVKDYLYPMSQKEKEEALLHLLGDSSEGDQVLQKIYDHEVNRHDRFLWRKSGNTVEIPYVIDKSVEDKTDQLEVAMKQYNNLTCIRFKERSNEPDYVLITKGDACLTEVGRKGGQQYMKLSSGCFYPGTLVHELGHTIGFYHEHQRPDRDRYIVIHDENILEGQENNFQKVIGRGENMITDFDYHSIMIYGDSAFSKDFYNKKTMEPKNADASLTNPYSKPGLSDKDVARIRKLYRCDS